MSMYSIPTPPPELRHHLNQETFTKAQLYGRDKMTFNIRQMMFNYALSFCMIKFGVFKFAWDATARAMDTLGLAQDRVVRTLSPLLLASANVRSSTPSCGFRPLC